LPAPITATRSSAAAATAPARTSGDAAAAGPYATANRFLDAISEIAARIIDLQHCRRRQAGGRDRQQIRRSCRRKAKARANFAGMSAAASARPFGVPALQIAGWYCSAGREVVDWALVACMPDRLKLVIGDSALDKSFAPHRGQAHLLRPAQPDTRSDAGARR